MDQGRPLEKSPPGPWTGHLESKATPLSIIQHHPSMAFKATTNRLNPDANVSAEVQQSTSTLPLQYDSLIELVGLAREAPQDPLSMCIPLFAHAAFSEVQFLNLMESRIQIQISNITEGISGDALGTLHFFSSILNRHSQQLKDSIHALRRLDGGRSRRSKKVGAENPIEKTATSPVRDIDTPRETLEINVTKDIESSSSDGTFTAKGLLTDYEHLHTRCANLSKTCTQGITLAMNKMTIEESRKAIEQSERVKKLTLLATLFIPLSFSSSLLGMNIDLLGQNAVKFWWFFILCIPITLSAYAFYLWDLQVLKQWWSKFWKACSAVREEVTIERGKKNLSHMV